MIVYPAIDIRGGRAVRLVEGDFNQETVFDADPADAARRWEALGAEWIHVVDLDGARDGERVNQDAIERIRAAVTTRLQLGGGLRSVDDLREVQELGIDRMVIGSAAIRDPEMVEEAIRFHGDAIAVGLDARDGKLAAEGWLEQTDVDALALAERFSAAGLAHLVFTDIRRDGRLQGPNLKALEAMVAAVPAGVIASGGVGSLADIRHVRDHGAAGVIIGAALYHRRITLADAISVASGHLNHERERTS